MTDTIYILLAILIFLNIVFFLLGCIIGQLYSSRATIESQPKSFFSQNTPTGYTKEKISIDETKYVTDISTSTMEKKYETLGDIKTSNEDIQTSINKLKNIKR